ncbi:MAG: hypothetical protein Q9222_004674 [Ikaeria aurantiellina]
MQQNESRFLSKGFLTSGVRRETSPPAGDVSQDESTGKSRGSPARKHGREASTANGLNLELPLTTPAAKRSRRSNGSTMATNEPPVINGEPRGHDLMDLDQNGFTQHEPPEPKSSLGSPADEGQTATERASMDVDDDAPEPEDPRPILTNGPSVGVQSDKVVSLGPETSVVLPLPQKNVLHTAWSPTDPLLLAVAGDALCRIWTLPDSPEAMRARPNPNNQYIDLLEPGDESTVTAMAWSPDGQILAVATRNDDTERAGEVSLWSKSGKSIDSLVVAQDMILAFRWSPTGSYLLGITASGHAASTLILWNVQSQQAFPAHRFDCVATDAVWCDERAFIVCGYSLVAECVIDSPETFSVHQRTEPEVHRNWTYVRYDTVHKIAAFAAEDSATLAFLESKNGFNTVTAHTAEITAIAFEPVLDPSSRHPASPSRLATSSLDGDIRIWDASSFSPLYPLEFGRVNPPMAISYATNGRLLAAANGNRVQYWDAETSRIPRAVWTGPPLPILGTVFGNKREDGSGGMFMDRDSGIGEEEDVSTHSLSWDATGERLAFGIGNQVGS